MTTVTVITRTTKNPQKSCFDKWSFLFCTLFIVEVRWTSLCSLQLLYWLLSKSEGLTKLTGYNSLDASINCHLAAAAVGLCWSTPFLKEIFFFFFKLCGKDMDSTGGGWTGKCLHMAFMKILALKISVPLIWGTYCLFHTTTSGLIQSQTHMFCQPAGTQQNWIQ